MSYNYRQLVASRDIRLVHIQPAEHHAAPVECTIETADLDRVKSQYFALSYSWALEDGNAGESELITIDGLSCQFTKNLLYGMKRIRRDDRPLCIWIDALSIDQDDDAERSSQVAMMADIYAGAEAVLIWLGEGDDDEKMMLGVFERVKERPAAFTTIQWSDQIDRSCFVQALLGEACSDCAGCVAFQESDSREQDVHIEWLSKTWITDLAARHEAARMYNLAMNFFSKRYWRRRWILQELYFATRQLLYWGPCSVEASKLPAQWLEDFTHALSLVEAALRTAATGDAVPVGLEITDFYRSGGFIIRAEGLSQWCIPQEHWQP